MGLCSSNQKRLAVTAEEHKLRDLRKYSDAQAHELVKKNAQIAEHQVEICEKDEELIQAREDLERLAECLKIQEDLHETSEQRHLDNFQNIVLSLLQQKGSQNLNRKQIRSASAPIRQLHFLSFNSLFLWGK